ncbi:MAG TPA: class IV adenylate cyclase [Chloroflexota bacterium]|nr:class IV adenylate cyclase [Chloroflexota bacterium]
METEIKLEVANLEPIRERLRALGATRQGTADETNLYLDRDGELRGRDESLRLRQDARVRVTWKGPSLAHDGVTERPEVEVVVSDFAVAQELFERLGYAVVDRVAKQRETWRLPDAEIALDTLAFGRFVEIEAPPAVAIRVARSLGLNPQDGITVSYRVLQQQRAPSA